MFGLIEFLVEEFLPDIIDAVTGSAADVGADAVGAAADVAVSAADLPTAVLPADPGGVGGGSALAAIDGGIAGDRFDPPPVGGAYLPR